MSAARLTWDDGAYESDTRRLARCGGIAVGAIFLPYPRTKYIRWRCWISTRQHPVDGTSKTIDEAKAAVEKKFAEFCELAGLVSR